MAKRKPALPTSQMAFTFDAPRPDVAEGGLALLERQAASAVGRILREDPRSRFEVAGQLSALMDADISKWMLDAYSAEARDGHNVSFARFAEPPSGGAGHDYRRWTREVAEVTRAWVFPRWMGAGTVGVAFMMDDRADPIPTADDVLAVQQYLDGLAPVTATVIAFAPIPEPLDLVISGLTPDTPEVRAAVSAEVGDLLFRVASPGGGVLISQLREAISTAAGEQDNVLTSPTANVVAAPGGLLVLNGITYA